MERLLLSILEGRYSTSEKIIIVINFIYQVVLTYWVQVPHCLHVAQSLGNGFNLIDNSPGLWLVGPVLTNTCVWCKDSLLCF